jgi:hypothetical protein
MNTGKLRFQPDASVEFVRGVPADWALNPIGWRGVEFAGGVDRRVEKVR